MLKRKRMAQMMRRCCHKGQCLYSIFPTQIMRKPARLQCTKRHARAMFGMLPGETSRYRQGNDDIAKCDKRMYDHADVGKCCKAPDKIGPPLAYMEKRGVFKPVEAINNPMGLCRFYRMSFKKSNVLTGPKSTDCTHKIHDMIKLAKGVRWPLTVIVFKGETVTPLGLL